MVVSQLHFSVEDGGFYHKDCWKFVEARKIFETRGRLLGVFPCFRYCAGTWTGWVRLGDIVDLFGMADQDGDEDFILWGRQYSTRASLQSKMVVAELQKLPQLEMAASEELEEHLQELRSKATELFLREEWNASIEAYSHFITLCTQTRFHNFLCRIIDPSSLLYATAHK